MHVHAESQLTFAAAGVLQVHTEDGRWLVPPQLAAWIPAGVRHRVDVLTDAELWIVHWEPSFVRKWAPEASLENAHTLHATPLLRHLLRSAVTPASPPKKIELIVKLMLHELIETAHAPTFLPLPVSSVGQRVAHLALDDHRSRLDLQELAARGATSVRTISRIFPAETGLTFKTWRQRARIVNAMGRLARGQAISQVMEECGFASTAAFSSAFRQVTGTTPTGFFPHDAARGRDKSLSR